MTEQQLVARLVHKFEHPNPDVQFEMYKVLRECLGCGGERRVIYTLVPLVFATLQLAFRFRDLMEDGKHPVTDIPKLFQFCHGIATALTTKYVFQSLQLFLQMAQLANNFGLESLCAECVMQSLNRIDETPTEREKKRALELISTTIYRCGALEHGFYKTVVTRIERHVARIRSKPDRCRLLLICVHLHWPVENGDTQPRVNNNGQNALQCLQRALKVADISLDCRIELFVEILNQYVNLWTRNCPTVTCMFIQSLLDLICVSITDDIGWHGKKPNPTVKYVRNTVESLRMKMKRNNRLKLNFPHVLNDKRA